jgi:hypothetical protein
MGIYAVTPGEEKWESNDPIFDSIKINDENNINIINYKKEYVNGKSNKIFLLGEKIKNQLIQKRSSTQSQFDYLKNNSENTNYKEIIPVPAIQAESKSFKDKMKVAIISQNPKDVIYYNISDKNDYLEKKLPSVVYTEPFEITETSTILAYVKNDIDQSNTIAATFYKKPNNYTIDIKSKYNPQYHAGGPEGLLDGIKGTENWRKGDWQGYQSQDFEAIIDLQSEKLVSEFNARFLQDSRSWILMPTKVDYYTSNDNVNFTLVGTISNAIDPKETDNKIHDFQLKASTKISAKYIKVKAYNFGKLPEWHQGAGGDAFIFIDEITIK